MTEHPRVLVEAVRLRAVVVAERRGVQRRGFGFDAGVRNTAIERITRESTADQDQLPEIDAGIGV